MKFQNTKIVATVGPACEDYEVLLALAKAGVNVFRLNFSHGAHEYHQQIIYNIIRINEEHRFHLGILADLQGPKLRVGKIEGDGIHLEAGDIITFTNTKCIGNRERVYMSYDQFAQDVVVGEKVLIDDGKLIFTVDETNKKDEVKLKVQFGGVLKSNKGVNLPDTHVSLPSITEKDYEDLMFILTQPVNWIALSFVRSADDIKHLRNIIKEHEHPAKIIAKIEKPEAVRNIDKIIAKSDAIMVARGDLGVEVPMEKLPLIQKEITSKCLQLGRPCIVATQMMESMIHNPSPARADITDVADAVLDGADAVMLSGETSVGDHPVKVVEAMSTIIEEAEAHYHFHEKKSKPSRKSNTFFSDVICYQAVKTAEYVGAKALLGMTVSGYTAFRMAAYRPPNAIYIFSDRRYMLATLNLVWGVRTFFYDRFTTTDDTISDVVEILKVHHMVKPGDLVVNTGSMPLGKRARTNMLKLTLVE